MAYALSAPSQTGAISGKSDGYLDSLVPDDRKRYKEKLNVHVGDTLEAFPSPYELWDVKGVWDDSPANWPNVSYGDIYSYLVDTPGPFTKEKLKAHKSLEAYDYFVSRKVGPVSGFTGKPNPTGYVLLKADVRPGQAESVKNSHLAWVICTATGEITVGHCDCKAGLGETCSHVAALLFKVEVAVRVGLTTTACTSEACRWNRVFGSNSLTAPAEEIDFRQGKKTEVMQRGSAPKAARSPLACTAGDETYIEAYSGFLTTLHEICPSACIFKSLPRLDPEETDTANSQTDYSEHGMDFLSHNDDNGCYQVLVTARGDTNGTHPVVPESPPSFPLIGANLPKYTSVPTNTSQVLEVYAKKLDITYEEGRQLEAETKKQAECPKWFEVKYPRLTSSNFGKIYKKMNSRRAKLQLAARDLLQPKQPTAFLDKYLKWGREHEGIAVQVYSGLEQKKHCLIYESGIFISPEDSFLAASPDRLVYDCKATHPWGLLEVKCPYTARDKTPLEAARTSEKFMSKESNGILELDKTHDYYFQVQGQMAMTGAKWCDFVIYTKSGIAIERITFDIQFWEEVSKKLAAFFYSHFLPKYVAIKGDM